MVDAVVGLVAVAQAAQDLLGLLLRGLVHADLLEAPLQRRVALEVLAVLVERGGADGLQLAPGQRRLEDRGGVDGPLGRARADQVVQLVDEQDDVAALGDLLHHLLQALLELAAVLGAGHQGGQVEGVDLLVLQQLRDLVGRDALGQALDHRGLAHAGLADQHRVVLGAAREDLHDPLDLLLATDDRVELALRGELGQVAPELVEQLARLLLLLGAGLPLLAAARAGEHPDDLVADLLGVRVEVGQDAGGDALVLAHQAEQDVLRPDVVVAERQRLAERQLEHLLRPGRERDLAGGDLLARPDDADHLGADLLDRDLEALEHPRGKALLLTEEPEQDVLGPDVVVLEGARLFLRQYDDLPGTLGETFEHRGIALLLTSPAPPPGRRTARTTMRPGRGTSGKPDAWNAASATRPRAWAGVRNGTETLARADDPTPRQKGSRSDRRARLWSTLAARLHLAVAAVAPEAVVTPDEGSVAHRAALHRSESMAALPDAGPGPVRAILDPADPR